MSIKQLLGAAATVPCRLCGRPARISAAAERCDSCYEIERRIHDSPALALKIITALARQTAPGRLWRWLQDACAETIDVWRPSPRPFPGGAEQPAKETNDAA